MRKNELQIGGTIYRRTEGLGNCTECCAAAFALNAEGVALCEEHLTILHYAGDDVDENEFVDQPLGADDPNCCENCGSDLDANEFCWECDF